jgi:hypothetical protein
MKPFVHFPMQRLVVCSKCHHAVLPGNVDTHLKDADTHNMRKENREHIVEEIQQIRGLIQHKLELNDLIFPLASSPPIPELGKPRTDGMQCKLQYEDGQPCRFISCHEDQIRKHCREQHAWENKQKGRPKAKVKTPKKCPWRTGVHCQHFFVRGPGAQYFEVSSSMNEPASDLSSETTQFQTKKQMLLEAIRKAQEEEDRQITEPDEAKEPSPWLRRTGWASHLEGLDKKKLRTLVAAASDDEPDLQILCKAFDWLIQDAQYHAIREVIGLEALFEANKKEVDKETQMPFDSWMDITTIKRYTKACKQVLCFIFRAEDEEPEERPPYELTEEQQMAIEHTRIHIEVLRQWKITHALRSEDEEDAENEEEEEESDEEIELMENIQKEILRLWITILNHPLQDNEYKSVLISALAVLGIREDYGWVDAEDYTPTYSAIIKMSRLMVIQEAYKRRQNAIKQRQGKGSSLKEAEREVRSYYHLVRKLVHAFMTMTHDGRDPMPIQWLYRTRSYGFKIRYTTTAHAKIQWIGHDILYPGMRFSMTQFRSMVHGLVAEAREVLFSKLMMVRMNGEGEIDPQQVPTINWDQLVDQPSESRIGWSFLDDERNQFAVDGKWWLFERIYKEKPLRDQFWIGTEIFEKRPLQNVDDTLSDF